MQKGRFGALACCDGAPLKASTSGRAVLTMMNTRSSAITKRYDEALVRSSESGVSTPSRLE